MKRSNSSAPQRARSRGGVALERSPGYATQNLPRGYSHWVAPPQAAAVHGHLQQQRAAVHGHPQQQRAAVHEHLQQQAAAVHGHPQQQRPAGYHPEHQRFRGNTSYSQTAPFQRAAGTTPGHGNHQRSTEMQSQWSEKGLYEGPSVLQTTEYSQLSSMQNLAGRMMRAPPPSTLTSSSVASGSTGGTFSSVSKSEQGGFQQGPDASQPSNLPYQMSLLQVTDNAGDFSRNMQAMQQTRSSHGVNGYVTVPNGQVSATVTTRHIPQEDPCSHCHKCVHTRCHTYHLPAHHPSHGDHANAGAVRIGYCPIHSCNRGPGSNRPFPRTCNLLEHLRGVHKLDIPRGVKLRAWLISQQFNPDLYVEYANPRP
ncbi:hypothetical protein BGX38DRAFT_1196165 [Terfezia claveryi]|nr:hypothetical protein BGX38DRAFT_1196165 [Terfezia claveryi]